MPNIVVLKNILLLHFYMIADRKSAYFYILSTNERYADMKAPWEKERDVSRSLL